jgi:hypothetical protein
VATPPPFLDKASGDSRLSQKINFVEFRLVLGEYRFDGTHNRGGRGMIKRPEDPQQVYFVSRAELVSDEPLVVTVDRVVRSFDLEALYGRYREGVVFCLQ